MILILKQTNKKHTEMQRKPKTFQGIKPTGKIKYKDNTRIFQQCDVQFSHNSDMKF